MIRSAILGRWAVVTARVSKAVSSCWAHRRFGAEPGHDPEDFQRVVFLLASSGRVNPAAEGCRGAAATCGPGCPAKMAHTGPSKSRSRCRVRLMIRRAVPGGHRLRCAADGGPHAVEPGLGLVDVLAADRVGVVAVLVVEQGGVLAHQVDTWARPAPCRVTVCSVIG